MTVYISGWQLLVFLATKDHGKFASPLKSVETVMAKKKRKTIEFREKKNGHLHDFFHSVLGERDEGIACKNCI